MIEVETRPCLGCGQTTWFAMTDTQYLAWQSGIHVQTIFLDWSPEDLEMLTSGTCPSCWEEMCAEEEDWVEDPDNDWDVSGVLEMSDFPEYQSDYYVDRDCD